MPDQATRIPLQPEAMTLPVIARLGLFLRRHQRSVMGVQWLVVVFYVVLVAVPAWLPLPPETSHLWNDLTRMARFIFWGVWWPLVIVSVMVFGRLWCGIFCPEGALSEWASRYGSGRAIPRWMRWPGWPFVAFVGTTVMGQMTSVYEYPKPALLILGGSTLAAIAVGVLYGRRSRVWCRQLCPVSGVFALLSKLSWLRYEVNKEVWDAAKNRHPKPVNCAPLINIRNMQSASPCHMCGRCAGERDAVQLRWRRPAEEILRHISSSAKDTSGLWGARLLIFGILGVALAAFQWSASPWLIFAKQWCATWLLDHHHDGWLQPVGHWWLLTDYPEVNDVMNVLDGMILLGYLGLQALIMGIWIRLWMAIAAHLSGLSWERLTMVLIPLAGISLVVGLSFLTTTQLAEEGIHWEWTKPLRALLLAGAATWGLGLVWHLAPQQRFGVAICAAMAMLLPLASWWWDLFVWT